MGDLTRDVLVYLAKLAEQAERCVFLGDHWGSNERTRTLMLRIAKRTFFVATARLRDVC